MGTFPKTRPCLWDGAVALAVVFFAAVLTLFLSVAATGAGSVAVVSVDGVEIDRVNLDRLTDTQARTYTGNGYTLQVEFHPDGEAGVRVSASDCPTQDCVHTGRVARSGQSIVCLPARLVIQIEGADPSTDGLPDIVLG